MMRKNIPKFSLLFINALWWGLGDVCLCSFVPCLIKLQVHQKSALWWGLGDVTAYERR